jgi:hypothetical protein
MPRRIADYPLQFPDWNMISRLGGFVSSGLLLLDPAEVDGYTRTSSRPGSASNTTSEFLPL